MSKSHISESQFLSPSSVIGSNEDLLSEIFLRLPIKSIFRFKCVSKQWHFFITDPQLCNRKSIDFCKKITRLCVRRKKTNSALSKYDVIPLYEFGKDSGACFSKSFRCFNTPPMKILQSCNGLFICRASGNDNQTLLGKSYYYVCNATTFQSRILPDPVYREFSNVDGVESVIGVHLAFDPRKSRHFKVLCVYLSETVSGDYEMEVYSSETDEWRRACDTFAAKVDFSSGVYWNGAINWFSLFGEDGLYFDVEKERFGKLPMLPFPAHLEEREIRYFGESYDHLHLVESYELCPMQFNLYEMDKEYKGWFVRYRVDIEAVVNEFKQPIRSRNPRHHGFQILSVIDGGDEEDPFLMLSVYGRAVRYNLVDKSFEKIWDFGKSDHGYVRPVFGWNDTVQYIESICTV